MKQSNLAIALSAAALLAATAQPARASLKGGVEAFVDGDYERVVSEFKKVLKGKRKPAKAQLIMARMYLDGLGVEVNYSRAYQYLLPSADKNNAWAQYQIARLIAAGQGPMQSYRRANDYYKKAAEAGYAPAQLALGKAYLKGQGIPQIDKVGGYAWINLAVTGLSAEVRAAAAELRDQTAAGMSRTEIARAQTQALKWSEHIEIEEPEIADLMREAREMSEEQPAMATASELAKKLVDVAKASGLEGELTALEKDVEQLGQELGRELEKQMAAQQGEPGAKKPPAPQTAAAKTPPEKAEPKTAKKPASGAAAGDSAAAEESGFIASVLGAITSRISAIFNFFFGPDEPAPAKPAATAPAKAPVPAKPAVAAPAK